MLEKDDDELAPRGAATPVPEVQRKSRFRLSYLGFAVIDPRDWDEVTIPSCHELKTIYEDLTRAH